MKTTFLLLAIFLMVSFDLQAQYPQHKIIYPDPSARVGRYIPPIRSGLKPDPTMANQKRNMFSPSTSIWKWDTILCYNTSSESIPFQRVSRMYNSLGEVLTQLTERRQGSFIWENLSRETFTYDSAGNWLTYLAEAWQNNAWTNFIKQSSDYNSNGDMVDWKREIWQSTFWAKWGHYAWHFNSNGLNDTLLSQGGQDSLWVNTSLWTPSYDTNGYVTSSLTHIWANNSWAVSQLTTNTNDYMGNCLTELSQNWQNAAWVNNSLGVATYDSAGHCLSSTSQLWQNNSWVNTMAFSFTYDSAGNMLSWLNQNWSNNAWVNSDMFLYVFDGSNNMLSSTSQNWISSAWRNTYMEQYTYDSSGNSLTGKYLKWYNGNWHPDNGSLYVFSDYQNDSKVNLQNVYRYYADVDSVLVFTEPAKSFISIRLYPNPAHSIVYVAANPVSDGLYGTLTLFDLQGQAVFTKPLVSATTAMDISGLKPGVYFVKISDNRLTSVMKLVKN